MNKTFTVGQLVEVLTGKISNGEITRDTPIALDGFMDIHEVSTVQSYDGTAYVVLDTYDPALEANLEVTND